MARRTLEKLLDKLPDGKDRDAFRTVARAFDQETLAAPQTERQRESALRRAAAALRKTDRSLRVAPLLARGWEVIGPGLERLYRQNCASMARARITGKDGDFHQWRKRAKFLWYQVRMLTPIWPKHLAKLAERLNDLQDQLGADHDLAVLKGFLLRRPDRFGGEPTVRRITTCLDKLMVKLRENSQALGNKIFVHRPRRFVNELGERWGEWQTRRKASPRDNPPSASARSR